jgi:hypothetical protein
MIDFIEGYKAKSSIITPSFFFRRLDDRDWPTGDDSCLIRYYTDNKRSKMLGEIRETTVRADLVGAYLKKGHMKQSRFFTESGPPKIITQIEGDDISLLPRRGVAYAFRERKFVMLDINALQPIPTPKNVFGDLKIDVDHKRIIKSLVKAHFQKQKLHKQQPNAGLNQDLFQGKGAGLFILLHGVPGVGKTATAEAVAQSNKKPLFAITCGDLGFSPKEVDESLRDIFRLAHLWDCVLLLDEADIFLTRRDPNDLKRNALVSGESSLIRPWNLLTILTTTQCFSECLNTTVAFSSSQPIVWETWITPLSLGSTSVCTIQS